ncbi:aminoglycoside phosphotransferase family protein [Streptomyces sp. NPDC014864]|uniref:aminoglycoside phosphotransferase family protein n=1 Tax=Streptomyces sp. NPDC014864 TaxID=3364924 RepID=UPI0036FC6F9E
MCADTRTETLHPGEPEFPPSLVRRLMTTQFPRWAELPLTRIRSAGTSNVMYRLGRDMVVRLPRTPGAAEDVHKEHHWLPRLAPALPVAVPEPLGLGTPDEHCPWPWSVYRWLHGDIAEPGALTEPALLAGDLAHFVTALHRVDPADGPPAYRSESLAARDGETRAAIAALREVIDAREATAAWDAALCAPPPAGPPVWIHSDLQPANLLLARGRLNAVIDFGCLGLGDPAVDLIVAWYVLPADGRARFRAALETGPVPPARSADRTGEAAWARGRGWALSIALLELSYYRGKNPWMATVARRVVEEVLDDARRAAGPAGRGAREPDRAG